jgi:hypothetical protein
MPFRKVIVAHVSNGETIEYRNHYVRTDQYGHVPLFFLAGPLQGAEDYHPHVFRLLQERLENFILVIPQRYQIGHPLLEYEAVGSPDYFRRQRHFEAHYIKQAREAVRNRAGGGALLFNLCCQVTPRTDDRPYATDSWREAAETYTRLSYEPDLSVIVRAEKDFPGEEILNDCFNEAIGGSFPFFRTLEELADEATRRVS